MRGWLVLILVALILESGAVLAVPFLRVQAGEATLEGVFSLVWGDAAPGAPALFQDARYFLTDDTGATTELAISAPLFNGLGSATALVGRRVVATVEVLPAPRTGTPLPATVHTLAIAPGAAPRIQPRVVAGSQPFINILCKFSDRSAEPQPPAYFDALMGDGADAIGAFWREASYGQIDIHGSMTYGWLTLPQTQSYYVGTSANLYALAQDCTHAASASTAIDFTQFRGVNLLFNDSLGCCSWGGTQSMTLSGVTKAWPMTWLAPWGYGPNENGGATVMAHEMGHAFGLVHSGSPTGTTYGSDWDVMSGDWDYCSSVSAVPYRCPPQHQIAYDKDVLGWIPANRKLTYSGLTRKITLGQLVGGTMGDYLLVVIPHPGGSTTTFTTVEMRHRQSFDTKLPGDAVIINDVNTTRADDRAWVQGTDGQTGAMFVEGNQYLVPGLPVMVMVQSLRTTQAVVVISNGTAPALGNMDQTTGIAQQTSTFQVHGANFSPEATVTFGPDPAATVVWQDATTLTVTAPALPAGVYPVTVTNPDGLASPSLVYTYNTPGPGPIYAAPVPHMTVVAQPQPTRR